MVRKWREEMSYETLSNSARIAARAAESGLSADSPLPKGGFNTYRKFYFYRSNGSLISMQDSESCTFAGDKPSAEVKMPPNAAFIRQIGGTSGNGARQWNFVKEIR